MRFAAWMTVMCGVALALGAAGDAAARDRTCRFGTDCLCDRLAQDASVVYCEDFEDPALDDGDRVVRGEPDRADGWADKYGPGAEDCIDMAQPQGEGLRDEGMEGRNPWSCIDVVQEGACEAGDDCVFDGVSSLAHRMRPGHTGGIVGNAQWRGGKRRDFGFTMAMKWSDNYVSPKQSGAGPAHKTNEFGERRQCILGCAVANAGNPDLPFAATLKPFAAVPTPTLLQGQHEVGSSGYRFGPAARDYAFERDWGSGRWGCLQMQWTGWGTARAEARYWINGKPVVHIRDIDMTTLRDEGDGIDAFAFNAYYNGENNSGYPGSSVAYRLEDNLVVTNGAPVSCAAIGFETSAGGGGGGQSVDAALRRPQRPDLGPAPAAIP